jgi:hypothetical protein
MVPNSSQVLAITFTVESLGFLICYVTSDWACSPLLPSTRASYPEPAFVLPYVKNLVQFRCPAGSYHEVGQAC